MKAALNTFAFVRDNPTLLQIPLQVKLGPGVLVYVSAATSGSPQNYEAWDGVLVTPGSGAVPPTIAGTRFINKTAAVGDDGPMQMTFITGLVIVVASGAGDLAAMIVYR